MATSVDMSLSDIIKSRRNNERTRGRGRGLRGRGQGRSFGGGRMYGAVQRGPLAVNARPSSYTIAKPVRQKRRFPWQVDLFEDSIRATGMQEIEMGTKLFVSNLHHGVTNEDIRELFSEIGDMKRYAIHFDKTGRPSGSAEVVYTRRSDAFLAHKKYNSVLLDGKPMKIEIVGANPDVPVTALVNVTGLNGRKRRTVIMPGQGTARMGPPRRGPAAPSHITGNTSRRGGFKNGRGRGGGRGSGGRGKKQPVEKSAEQLDKELESYYAEVMNTNCASPQRLKTTSRIIKCYYLSGLENC